MEDRIIKDKILNNQELTEEEVHYIVYGWKEKDCFESGEHHRWWSPITLIYKIDNKYYSIWYKRGLTECQESYFPEQIAKRVEKRPTFKYVWVEWVEK